MDLRSPLRIGARGALAIGIPAGIAAFLGVPLPPFERSPEHVWRELKVRLVDAAGHPVPELTVLAETPSVNGAQELARGKTDERGEARLGLELPLPPRARVLVDLPLAKPPEASGAQAAEALAFARPLELAIPQSSALAVRVEDERGVSLRDPVAVTLHWRERGDGPSSIERLRGWTITAHHGLALFARVAPGRKWRVTAEDPAGHAPFQAWEGDGPLVPGGAAEITVRRLVPWPLVEGVALDEAGSPLAGSTLLAAFPGESAAPLSADGASTSVACDERGRFAFPLRGAGARARRMILRTSSEPRREVEVELPSPSEKSRSHDVGVLRLARPPLLVAGQVLDAAGAPAPNAWIEVLAWSDGANESDLSIVLPAARCTDAAGRFALHLRHPARSLLVRAGTQQHVLARFAGVPAGTSDLRLRLALSTSLRGKVRIDPGFSAAQLEVRLAHADGRRCIARPDAAGAFAFEGVPHGRWTPELHTAMGCALVLDAVELGPAAPPALELDARGRLTTLAVTWPGARGAKVVRARLRDARGEVRDVELAPGEESRWVVPAARGPYLLLVEGREPQELQPAAR